MIGAWGADSLRHGQAGCAIIQAMIAEDIALPEDLDLLKSMVRAFRGMWAAISHDLGHAFHAIVGSLADGGMESGLTGLVKRFRDGFTASQAFA